MNHKVINSYFILFSALVLLMAPSANGQENYIPNLSSSSTYSFNLDSDGNCVLYIIMRIKNIDDNLFFYNTSIGIPINITSFSKEQPNVTSVVFGELPLNYSVNDYEVTSFEDNSYLHSFILEYDQVSFKFNKYGIVTLRAKIKIHGASSNDNGYYKFALRSWDLPRDLPYFKEYSDFIVRVNLPNDPYFWAENLDTIPKYDYRSIFGRGESMEWWYDGTETHTDSIYIDYLIHPDPLKKALDNATVSSLKYAEKAEFLGNIALLIAIISIPSVIWSSRDLLKWIEEKRKNRP